MQRKKYNGGKKKTMRYTLLANLRFKEQGKGNMKELNIEGEKDSKIFKAGIR